MSKAGKAFDRSINDAEELLKRFDNENKTSSGKDAEILKRAGMVIALASWETYIKDRIKEEFDVYLKPLKGSLVGRFVQKKLNEDLKRYFNPNSDRTKKIFQDYFEIDITENWVWNNYDSKQAKTTLNNLISTRCDAAHQAVTTNNPNCAPHLVKRDDLDKAIRFLKGLVDATEKVEMIK
ncbi:HEPN domain-containing protein [Desulfobacter sp. UBA2225]|uniref:HEPN domain-containing protein n=1 Tax=Desulfobacter sp. UBA2225 TaxID=1961413 RepID=UPI00257A147C|nr:HEPN domain-containing protein [Desulfobacter sp. UBA2225]